MNRVTQLYVGIDIAKHQLDVCLYPTKQSFKINNDVDGINKLIKKLSTYRITQIVFEASGGYENLAYKMLARKGHEVWRVDPKRIKAFIISEGIHAKTDKIDAEMIALFASQKKRSYEKVDLNENDERLRSLNKRRVDLISIITEENNRMKSPAEVYCKDSIKKHIEYMKNEVKGLDQAIAQLISQNKQWNEVSTIITSVPGIGAVTSAALIADMKELGKVNDKQIAALAGLAPFIHQSGSSKGLAKIKAGRHQVRSVLYMAALVAIRYNPQLKGFYERLRKQGKLFKVAIVAVMRKMIVMLNAMVQAKECWRAS